METVVPAFGLVSMIYAFIDFGRFLTNADWASVKTQVVAWAAGVGAVFLWAQTDMAETYSLAGQNLSKMDGWSLFAAGLGAASAAGVGYKAKQAFDNSDSAKVPPLFKPRRAA